MTKRSTLAGSRKAASLNRVRAGACTGHHTQETNMIGLMGVANDGKTLIKPDGTVMFKVPKLLALIVQRVQHWVAKKTWK